MGTPPGRPTSALLTPFAGVLSEEERRQALATARAMRDARQDRLVWPNGADISPEELRLKSRPTVRDPEEGTR